MGSDIGFDAQTPSLPPGGGAVSGLGETFSPDLSTGTGSFTVRLDLPNGPNDIGPRLLLRYDTAAGNGPFGMGFSVPMPRLVRSTAHRFPRYDGTDTLLLEGAGELVDLGGGSYRPQVDGGAWRAEASGNGFRLTDREGLFYFMGVSPAGRLTDSTPGLAAPRVYAWQLERVEDALGNAATFAWQRDGDQLYLSRVSYGVYEVQFQYESRPDPMRWGRAGFLITTALRCNAIELHLPSSPQPLVRRWSLSYTRDAANGVSLLSQVTLSGFDETGGRLDAPPLSLAYSSFQPRDLRRFQTTDPGVTPGPLSSAARRVELVDWNGDGLPDLLEISSGGKGRIWPNRGDCVWDRPHEVADLPLFATPSAAVGLVDMDGDGAADLIRLDQPIGGYIPRVNGGFGRPITWRQAPAIVPNQGTSRLVDLDGDGVVDLLSSSNDFLALYYRSDPDGWSARPQTVPRGQAPNLNLADPHVYLADMTGGGGSDLVRVDGSGARYWPYLGYGRWGEPVVMSNPPDLPFDLRPERLFLSDVDGDGCADLIYLDQGRVRYWINQTGSGFSLPREINYVPTGQIADARLADMRGSGTAGLLWSTTGAFDRGTTYLFLDFSGDTKPYLLTRIDNGVGLTSQIAYGTSAWQAAADARGGTPWTTTLPIAVPVVERLTATDAATGRVSVASYRYHDGRYDGMLREFAGFGRVDEDRQGDETSPTLRTTTWFHVGIDPARPDDRLSPDERRSLRAIRGRIYQQERFGLDGSPLQGAPYDQLLQRWEVSTEPTPGGPVDVPRLVTTVRSVLERAAAPAAMITTTNLTWDSLGNVTESIQTSAEPADPSQTKTLRTKTAFAQDPAGRFLARTARVQQFDGTGLLIADTITGYDNAPEGSVAAQGLVTKRSALVLSDALAAAVYGASLPDFASLGYYRRGGETGWWIDQARYERVLDASGLRGRVTGPRGAVTTFDFDANQTYPARVVDPRGNVVTAEHDYRACRVKLLTDASGATYQATFDALARPVTVVEPGDTAPLPTATYDYVSAAAPVVAELHRRAASGQAATMDSRERFDGSGSLIERRERDDTGEIVTLAQEYSARGFLARSYLEHRPASAAYARPDGTVASASHEYDALGRLVRRTNPDGSVRTVTYAPLLVEEADEEDNRTGPGASHAGTPTRTRFDATGRARAVEQNVGGRWVKSTYDYDVKGNLISHTDARGNVVRMAYDLLGRTLRVDRPEHATASVFDAAGNAVEARGQDGTLVFRDFDECNRPTAVRYASPAAAPVIQFAYHDAGRPAPPDAGTNTVGGHCARIDDEAGATIFDYDERGRVALKRSRPAGSAKTYDLTFTYRPDGQIASITYPDGGSGRLLVRYAYDQRGKVTSVPTVLTLAEYDLSGRRTRAQYANGTEQTFSYDPTTRRLSAAQITGPGGELRSTQYLSDLVGNLLQIDSPDPTLAATYTYDDLYRLTAANAGNGGAWSYTYDDVGNLTHKSDVGDYHYGENGAPATCLTSAGAQTFTYTPLGEMLQTPWGTQTFDPLGRLVRIVGAGGGQLDFTYDYSGARAATRTSGGATPAVDRLTPDGLYAIENGVLVLNFFDGEGIIARETSGGARLFLHADHLGGLALVTDGAGSAVDQVRYDPYGAVLTRTGPDTSISVGFTGGTLDAWSGLLYLNARYYNPALGRFVSADPIVQNALDPISWSPYAYCRDNPTTYVDPTGRGFWGIFLAALAIVALIVVTIVCVVLDVFSFGTLTPALAIGIIALGTVVGGVVGGLAASAKGGSTEDIITGILVGAAVGGWAAFASLFAGAAVASGIGVHGFWGAVIAGAVNGAINGAAIGFASGYAGGKGSLDDIFTKVWQGALIGLVAGAILGGVSYAIKPPTTSIQADVSKALTPPTPQAPPPGAPPDPASAVPSTVPSGPQTFGGAVEQVGTKIATKVGGVVAEHLAASILSSPLALGASVLVVDGLAGAWDLGYVPWILKKAGVISYSGKW